MTQGTMARKSMEPWLKDSVEFYDHQIQGVRTLMRQASFLLADEMGLGKSLEAITVLCGDFIQKLADRAVVVCPVSLMQNWADEFEKFTRIPHMVLEGTPAQRSKIIAEWVSGVGPRVLILNYEKVLGHLTELNRAKVEVAIFDEAHYIKNYRSKRTKACLSLKARRNFLLTGTPVLNNVNELWPILHKIDPIAFPKYWGFVNRYCVFGGFQNKEIVGTKNEQELREKLSKVMLRRLAIDVLPLKEPEPIRKYVTMHDEQRKIYDRVVDDMLVNMPGQEDPQEIDNALTRFLRLKQICGSTFSFDGEDVSAKMDLAQEDCFEICANQHKVIVFTQFRDVMDCYADRLNKMGITTYKVSGAVPTADRQGIVKEWTADPRPAVIICMLQVAGIGLNMTAARHIQFLDKLYVPGLNQQAIARANRIGQQLVHAVTVLEYITRKSVESRIEQILSGKEKTVHDVVEVTAAWKRSFLDQLKSGVRADAGR